jgi:dihydrofolate reductase
MRRVILQEFVTLNGMVSDAAGGVDFIPASTAGDRTFGREQGALMQEVDALLLGRETYSMFSSYWPNVTEGDDKEFAVRLNATPKIVFSRTLERAPWGRFEEARIVKGSPVEEVASLKKQPGKGMVIWGSVSLARDLIKAGLVDEFRLVVCPVVIPDGRPLFEGGTPSLSLKLSRVNQLDRGAVSMRYAPLAPSI